MVYDPQRGAAFSDPTRSGPREPAAPRPARTPAPAVVTPHTPDEDNQQAVIAFLSDAASYDVGQPVERIDTHCSIVFLVGTRAYKLKRAIRYASLDYRTLALRRDACTAELRLNRRTAPCLYLGMRAVTRDETGRLAFDGPGHALDYVVVMRRFAQEDLFDRMAQTGRLTPTLMRKLGEAVAHLHANAPPAMLYGGAASMRRVIAQNERELSRVADALDGAAVGTLGEQTRAWLNRVGPMLDARRDQGKVRRCHGDLRLANICLFRGQPTMFDCIEFSDEVGCIDVLYDLAFLLMDLLLSGGRRLANALFNAYLDIAPDSEGLRALPLFLALRAATRSYALAGGAARRADPHEAARRLAFARRHIEAGIRFLSPQPPVLILMGAADRHLRARVAAATAGMVEPVPGARLLHLDEFPVDSWNSAAAILAAGCSALVHGTFADATDEMRAVDIANRLGVRRQGFWIGPPRPNLDPRLWQALCPASAARAGQMIKLRLAHPDARAG